MKSNSYVAVCALLAVLTSSSWLPRDVRAQSATGAQTSLQFEVDPSWPKPLPERWVTGELGGVCVDAKDHVFVLSRANLYPGIEEIAQAAPPELERLILSTGFFRQKSKALIGMSQKLVAEHSGDVPADMEKLTALPGVGRKTANVVLGHALGMPGLPVDRHVLRVSNRIGIAEGDDPVVVEQQLCGKLPPDKWTLASDVQILHGRRICRPKPLCDQCSVRDDCDYYRQVIARERVAVKRKSSRATTAPPAPKKKNDPRPVRTPRR